MVTQQDKAEWYRNSVTQELLKELRETAEYTKERWENEDFIGESLEQGALQNAKALGGLKALREVIGVIEDCKEQLKEGDSNE